MARGKTGLDPAIVERVRTAVKETRQTMRMDPAGGRPEEIVGILHAIGTVDIGGRYNLPRNSLGLNQISGMIGGGDAVQLTILVDELSQDPAAVDFLSYTALCPPAKVPKDVNTGDILQMVLEPTEVLGVGRFWRAGSVQRIA